MKLIGDVGHVESCFDPFGDILVSVQDRCTVCTKRTIGSKIILDAPDNTRMLRGSTRSLFRSVWR
jgi:hypothetical protein